MKISIIGAGIKGLEQITIEALQKIITSEKVLTFCTIPPEFAFQHKIDLSKVEYIGDLYHDQAIDEDNYMRIVSKIKLESQNNSNVAVIVAGHPRIGVTFVQWMDRESNKYEFRTIPGVSSFDTMLNDLKRDPIERGTQILEANRILLFKQDINPTLDTYIYHVCSIGNRRTDYVDPVSHNQAVLLRNHLLKHFHPQHDVILIESANGSNQETSKHNGTVESLVDLLSSVTYSSTLFIPAAVPKTYDRNFLEFLKSDSRNGIEATL